MMTLDEIAALRAAATAVFNGARAPRAALSAREAARCLSGVVQLVSIQYSQDLMQRACADLAQRREAWGARQPEALGEATWTIAVVARGVAPLCGEEALVAALAFWASETNPVVWQQIRDAA